MDADILLVLTDILSALTENGNDTSTKNIEEMLRYNDTYTVFEEISGRLEVIDKRLDYTNQLLSNGFGLIGTFIFVLLGFKLLMIIYDRVGV